MTQGRSCPLHYRYRPEELADSPEPADAEVLYVAGGLYGNPYALDAIETLVSDEQALGRRVRLLFNGDFNWFNADDHLFQDINTRVLGHGATVGNVEYELAQPGDGAGCGCAYPDFVEDGVVERSNHIMVRLQQVAQKQPALREMLSDLPRFRCLMFGGLKVVVLHGDPESLAGWGLSHEVLAQQGNEQLVDWFRQTGADMLVSTHTCLPVMRSLTVDGQPRLFLNNGSAGMGNLAGSTSGLVARIALSPPPVGAFSLPSALPLNASLVPVDFPLKPWLKLFDRLWPAGSDAAVSYRHRILNGTSLTVKQLMDHSGTDGRVL